MKSISIKRTKNKIKPSNDPIIKSTTKIVTNTNQDLHRALIYYAPKYKVIKKILEKDPDAIDYIDSDGNTPLHIALKGYKENLSETENEYRFYKYNRYLVKVLKLSYKKKPSLLITKNNDGLVPYEVAVEEYVAIGVSIKIWRATKDIWVKEEKDIEKLDFIKSFDRIGRRDTMGSSIFIYDHIEPIYW